jgi:hypothetical protein
MGYFVGTLGNTLPLPGGVGGVEGGISGSFLAFGVDGSLAVLAYRTISYWLPAIPGAIEYFRLRRIVERWRRSDRVTSRGAQPRRSAEPPARRLTMQRGALETRPFTCVWLVHTEPTMDVPVQYFQSVIAIELAVAGALLWQMRFFESRGTKRRDSEQLPDSRLRLGLALVLGATMFGSLWAMADEGPKWAAVAVTIGLAVSLIPILLRVLPPLARDSRTNERDPAYAVTIAGLLAYIAIVAGFLVVLDIE